MTERGLILELLKVQEDLRASLEELKKEISVLRQGPALTKIAEEEKQYKKFYTVKEIAKLCDYGDSTVTSLIRKRKIIGTKENGSWLVSCEEYGRIENIIKEYGLAYLKTVEWR